MSNLTNEEKFNTKVPEGMMCSTCKFKLQPVTVAGFTQDRAGYGMCAQFTRKSYEVLWEQAQCPKYRSE